MRGRVYECAWNIFFYFIFNVRRLEFQNPPEKKNVASHVLCEERVGEIWSNILHIYFSYFMGKKKIDMKYEVLPYSPN